MDKVGEDEEKTIEEASNSVEETRTHKEDERTGELVDPVDSMEEGSTDPSNSHTVAVEDHDVDESDLEDEKVLELFRRNNSVRPEVAERNNFPYLNQSEEIVLQFQEEVTPTETEQTNVQLGTVNLNSVETVEGIKSLSASEDDTKDSSSDSDFDSRYYFDGSLPVSAHVQESESPEPTDENKVPLLCHKQPTSWRNCCGLLQLLRAANPHSSVTRNTNLQ